MRARSAVKNLQIRGKGANAAVAGGPSSPISSYADNYQITMLPTSSGLGANTSPLDETGTSFTVTVTPEPSALLLVAVGALGMAALTAFRPDRRPWGACRARRRS